MTVLRDPVARVLSEYSYIPPAQPRRDDSGPVGLHGSACGPRESGVFMSPFAHRLVEQPQRSHRFMPLEEFVEMAPGRLTTGRHATSTAFDALRGARKAAAAILLAQGS